MTKVRCQPRRNASKQFSDMTIPSEILDWVVEENFVITKKKKMDSAKQSPNIGTNESGQQTNGMEADDDVAQEPNVNNTEMNSVQKEVLNITTTETIEESIAERKVMNLKILITIHFGIW